MIKSKKLVALVASAMMVSTFAACTPAGNDTQAGTDAATEAATEAGGEATDAATEPATEGGEATDAATTAESNGTETTDANEGAAVDPNIAGKIETDGSSTVYPLSEIVIEEAKKAMPKLEVTASPSGSSAGIERLINGEIDIAAASRPIKDEEIAQAKEKGIEVTELTVAIDGIAVVAHKDNPVEDVSFDELKKIFGKDSKVKTWKEVNPEWPEEKFELFAPGTSSGTFEFFTEEVLETKKEARANDVQVSEDDNTLVTGVANSKGGLGYFGFTYYEENMDKLKALKINGIEASQETIADSTYPLARPIFLYVNKKAVAEKPEVKAFLEFYLNNAIELAKEIKMVPALEENIQKSLDALK